MRIIHWSLLNGSGLDRVAQDLSEAERKLGHDSIVLGSGKPEDVEKGMEADIQVGHSHIPDIVRHKGKGKWVWPAHGTPEHVIQMAVQERDKGQYGHADAMMLIQWWLQNADAIVTFWERHADIWASWCDKNTVIDLVELGVNKDFWKPVESLGKYAGNPSVFSAENCHTIKWPLDLVLMWEKIWKEIMDAQLHIVYLPGNLHRIWFPLINRCGAGFKAFVSDTVFSPEQLRNAFCSVDYVTSFVRYGDHNKLCLEAKASGAKIISFEGNEYADYWITEGDQRRQAKQMIAILKGEVEARQMKAVADISHTAEVMISIYERVMSA